MFMRIINRIVSVVLFLCALLGMHIGAGTDAPMIAYNKDQTVVTFSLEENPSTGYAWQAQCTDARVAVLTQDTFQPGASHGTVGASGTRKLSFTGVAAGTAELTLTYERRWENQPIRTLVIRVDVDDDLKIAATVISDDTDT